MEKETFLALQKEYGGQIERIRQSAHELHASVNQTYGGIHPYGFHLDMVADAVRQFGHLVCASADDVLPLFFGAYYHDSIEDARLTYNDVMGVSRQYMSEEQAFMATEIVYALTNDKGRNRAERAGEKYYSGIRETAYAPFLKLCDRFANISYTCSNDIGKSDRMRKVYKGEMRHFLESIDPHSPDIRFSVPKELVEQLALVLLDDMEREERDKGLI